MNTVRYVDAEQMLRIISHQDQRIDQIESFMFGGSILLLLLVVIAIIRIETWIKARK